MGFPANASNTILALFVTWLVYLLSLVTYRLYFHPLARFPGPKYAAISRWHEYYHEVVRKGQFTFVIQEYHKKYGRSGILRSDGHHHRQPPELCLTNLGPIVRIVPDEIHIQDSDFYDTLYTKAGRVDKYDWMANRFNSDQSVFAAPSANVHMIRRKALNPFFSRQRIMDFEDVIREKIAILVKHIDNYYKTARPFALSSGFMALAGDVIMQYCFSLNYDHLNSKDFETTFHEPFMAVSISGHLSLQFPVVPKILFSLPESWLQKTEPLFALIFQLQSDMRKQIMALLDGSEASSNTEKSKSPSVFREVINDPELPPSEKTLRRLQDEAQLVVAAGITTVGWALSVGAFHIINEPEIYARLREELDNAIPDPDQELHWADLEKLPYLTGCIKEAVRLSYPVSTRNPRLLSKPLVYKDWVIPPRTPVSMTMVDVNNDEDIFPEHGKFKPDRWINPPKTKDGSALDRFFVCFQKGTRSCLGVK